MTRSLIAAVRRAAVNWSPMPLVRYRAAQKMEGFHQYEEAEDLPPCEAPTRRYVIAFTPRSGSTMLARQLESDGRFGAPKEYLHYSLRNYHMRRFGASSYAEVLSALEARRTAPTGWFGLKADWEHMRQLRREPQLLSADWFDRAIWIYRKDLLSQAVSLAIAQQGRAWTSEDAAVRAPSYAYGDIVKEANVIRRGNLGWSRWFADTPAEKLQVIAYEDYLADRAAEFERLARFIDPEVGEISPPEDVIARQRNELNAQWKARFRAEVREEDAWIMQPQEWSVVRGEEAAETS